MIEFDADGWPVNAIAEMEDGTQIRGEFDTSGVCSSLAPVRWRWFARDGDVDPAAAAHPGPTVLSVCSGIGGLDLAISIAIPSARVVCMVEREGFAIDSLVGHMEAGGLAPAPLWTDLHTFDPGPWRGLVDGIIGGYPCQPFSVAGRQRGEADERHLWPRIAEIVGAIRPAWCFFENVSGHLRLGFRTVRDDLRSMGYSVAAGLFTAAEVGASHKRERLFILAVVADSGGAGRQQISRGASGDESSNAGRPEEPDHITQCAGQAVEHTACFPQREPQHSPSAEPRRHARADFGGGCGEQAVANPSDPRLQGGERGSAPFSGHRSQAPRPAPELRAFPLPDFPPGPDDLDGWLTVLADYPDLAPATPAQSAIRGVVDVPAPRVDQLRALGNGVVVLQAAFAFAVLAGVFRGEPDR